MMRYRRRRKTGLIAATILGIGLLQSPAFGQDAAWEGLINAGREALQQGNFTEAERHFESALEAAERFSADDARLGKSYNNLAAVYYAQEDYERAEPLMRRALAQLRDSLGTDNTEVAQTMKNLAALYYLQGDRNQAEDLLKQSLGIMETVHGPNHAFVATVLSNLAGLYQAENRYREAEPLLTRSLEIWEGLLGPEHPDVIRSRSLLASVRQARGGGNPPETTTATAPSPRALTPLGTDEGAAAAGAGAAAEVERATDALKDLAEISKAEADRARAGGVPVPALNPIGDVVDALAADAVAANADTAENDAADSAVDAAAAPDDGTPGSGASPVPGEGIETALAPSDAGPDQVTAPAPLLGETAAPGDVSFAVYLSTLWSVDEARRYWQALRAAMPDVLADKQMEIEEVASAGGDPFYRVLTMPYRSDPEAQAACEQIRTKLRTHDCSVVVRDGTAGG